MKEIEGLEMRYTVPEDHDHLKGWLLEPGTLEGFPMTDEKEVEESVRHWISYSRYKSSLTAMVGQEPCGIATLCLMPYKKIAHQCLVSLIVGQKFQRMGIGTALMNNLLHMAKEYFSLEVLYLEVYEGNPALKLYERFGFQKIGYQRHFMKEGGKYLGKIIMERIL